MCALRLKNATGEVIEALVALAYKNAKNSFTLPGLGKPQANAGSTNRKRIEAITLDKEANIFKVQNLYGKCGCKCDGHKREGRCAIPGET